ncbi:MAG: hypothetical protein JO116_10400, partial [Planctomycetaceae bacterium]|nr:hypothetical protein [Planctomycetaceae bacterium]
LEIDPANVEALVSRGWSRLGSGGDRAEAEARAYLDLKRGRDAFASYMAILGALGARRAGHTVEAQAFLDEAIAGTPPLLWPMPVLRYLNHEIPAQVLLDATKDDREATEAHAFLGLDLLQSGDHPGALEHLRWVRDHGIRRSIATDVAHATLDRIEVARPDRPWLTR